MSAVAERIADVVAAAVSARTADTEAYWALARSAVNGNEVSPEDVIDVCEVAGKPVEEFQSACDVIAARVELRKAHDAHPDLMRRASETEARRKSLEKHINEQMQKWEIELRALRCEENELLAAAGPGAGAWSKLLHGSPYPELRARYKATLDARMEVIHRERWLRERIRQIQDWIAQAEIDRKKQPPCGPGERSNTRAQNDAEHNGPRLGGYQRELAEREAEIARLSAEADAIEQEMTRP